MKAGKIYFIIFVLVFSVILILPIAKMNHVPGQVSETENRYLAEFPVVFDDEGHLNSELKSGFESWLSDNLGFRSDFMDLATYFKVKFLGQSTSDRVEIGWDDWYFFTPNNNVDIAEGKYKLSEEMLAGIAEKQQYISDWYASQGIQYILSLVPAKPSVYPEYISSGDYTVQETVCDQLQKYLEENTDVQVVNTKPALIEHKDQGKMCLQHDTHVTQRGAYVVYETIAERMRELGIEICDFPVEFSEIEQEGGDLAGMLGSTSVLGSEIIPHLTWDAHSSDITEGEWYDTMLSIQQADPDASSLGFSIHENPDAKNGNLVIYGDSHWQPVRNMPKLFAESFKSVIWMGLRAVDMNFDSITKPDVVLFSCSERLIDLVLTRMPNVPQFCPALPELPAADGYITPEEYGYQIPEGGICVDYNGVVLNSGTAIDIDTSSNTVTFSGWAADFNHDEPFAALYLRAGDVLVQCYDGGERQDVAKAFGGKESLTYTGVSVTVPTEIITENGVKEVEFIAVSSDGQNLYAPVVYPLQYAQ